MVATSVRPAGYYGGDAGADPSHPATMTRMTMETTTKGSSNNNNNNDSGLSHKKHFNAEQYLEQELSDMRKAFEEYIATSQDLELGLDIELQDMRGKLDQSAIAYDTLAQKLKTMEPMLRSLELSLGGTKKRLMEESKLRRTAEVAQVEAETRAQTIETGMKAIQDENDVLREECAALRADLARQYQQNEKLQQDQEESRLQIQDLTNRVGTSIQQRRKGGVGVDSALLMNVDSGIMTEMTSNKSTSNGIHGDDAYSEVLDELETVTEQLMTTQQKLWKTEDQLRLSEAKKVELEKSLRQLQRKKEVPNEQQMEGGLARELEDTRVQLEATKTKLKKFLAIDRKELTEQYLELEEQDDEIELLKGQVGELESARLNAEDQVMTLEVDLQECRNENVALVEEIACLRTLLQDGVGVERSLPFLRDTISKEERSKIMKEANAMREKEINALREQFKKVFKENAALKDTIEKLQSEKPSLRIGSSDKELLGEVQTLSQELLKAKEEHKMALLEAESSWKRKLDDAINGEFIPEGLIEEMEQEMKSAIDSAAEKVRMLSEEKNDLRLRVEHLERELQFSDTKIHNSNSRFQEVESNLKASRDEIIRLKKSNTHLTSELEYTTKIMSRMDAECERMTRQHSELRAELEIALCFVEDTGVDAASVHNTETVKAKEQVHRLSSSLNKLKGDYAALLEELNATRERFLDAREEAAKQHESDVNELSHKISDLQEALEKAEFAQKDLSNKLQSSRRKQVNSIDESGVFSKKELQDELISAKTNISELRAQQKESQVTIKSLQKELKQCRDALSSSRIENKKLEEAFEKMRTSATGASIAIDEESYGIPDFPLRANGGRRSETPTEPVPNLEVQKLRSSLDEVKLENELLKDRVIRMSGGQIEFSSSQQVDMLKKMLVEQSKELREQEEKLYEAKTLLRETEDKLKNTEEISDRSEAERSDLRSEVAALKDALHEARQDHADILHELERVKRLSTGLLDTLESDCITSIGESVGHQNELKDQVQKLSSEKSLLQLQLDDTKIALSVSQYAQEKSKEEMKLCQTKLNSSQKNVRTLKEELKKLASAFSELKTDHESLIAEYESHEKNPGTVGRSSKTKTELERLTKQLENLAKENSNLQELVTELEKKLTITMEDVESKNKEIETLECKLLMTQNEARMLSEEIISLSDAFHKGRAEYDSLVEQLASVQELFEKSCEEAERYGKESATQDLRKKLMEEKEELRRKMTEQLEKAFVENVAILKKLDEAESALVKAEKASNRDDAIKTTERETEILRLALRDSQNEVKALKERCFELEVVLKKASKDLDKDHAELDRTNLGIDALVSAAFDSVEMEDFKKQFNDLIEENINLEQVVRESEVALTLAKDVEDKNKCDISRLEKELLDLKSTKTLLQQEVYKLTVKLERSEDIPSTALDDARAAIEAESEAKVNSLRYQVEALTIENASLQARIRKLHSGTSVEKQPVSRRTEALPAPSLESSADETGSLRAELKRLSVENAELLEEVDQSHARTVPIHDKVNVPNVTADDEHNSTMNVLDKINSLLASVEFLEKHHEISLRTSHSKMVSTTQKAEEIRRKIAFLTYALQKAKKDHSDVLLQLKSVEKEKKDLKSRVEGDSSYDSLMQQKRELEAKLEEMELSLTNAKESEERHKLEAELSEKKYQESQQAAGYFKEQVFNLQEMLQDAKAEHACLREQLEQVNVKVSDLIKNAEDRGKSAALKELKKYQDEIGDIEELMGLYDRLNNENKALHRRLEETEAALAAARDMKHMHAQQVGAPVGLDEVGAKTSVSPVRDHTLPTSIDHGADAKEATTRNLKERMDRIVNESKKSQEEIRNLAVAMENRGVQKLEQGSFELSKGGLFVVSPSETKHDAGEARIVVSHTDSTSFSVSAGNDKTDDEVRDDIAASNSAVDVESHQSTTGEFGDDSSEPKPSFWWNLVGKRSRSRSRSNSPPAGSGGESATPHPQQSNERTNEVPRASQPESEVGDSGDIQSINSASDTTINGSDRQERRRGIEENYDDDDGETRDAGAEERE